MTSILDAFRESSSPLQLQDELGAGAAGQVFSALQVSMQRKVAVKVFAPPGPAKESKFGRASEAVARQRFVTVSQAIGHVQHPNVAAIFDVGTLNGHAYRMQELIDGRTLDRFVADEGKLEPRRAARMAAGLAEGLAAAHATGLAHRAIKPRHILIDATDRARLIDFAPAGALAPLSDVDLKTGAGCYRAPGLADEAADLFALGAVLFHLLAGEAPPVIVLPSEVVVPDRLRALVEKLLSRKAVSAAEVAAELCEIAQPVIEIPAPPPVEPPPNPKTVLVVDDEAVMLLLLSTILGRAGYKVLKAQSPEEALQMASSNRLDVVITDMMFPGGQRGGELVEALRTERPGLPVLAMSAHLTQDEREQLTAMSVSAFLVKPLEAAGVLEAVSRACRGDQAPILLVEHDRLARLVLSRLLERYGFVVRSVSSLQEAFEAIGASVPAAIVTDLNIGDSTAVDLLQFVRDLGHDTPVVVLSASPDADQLIAAFRLRVHEFVLKSDDTAPLVDAVLSATAAYRAAARRA